MSIPSPNTRPSPPSVLPPNLVRRIAHVSDALEQARDALRAVSREVYGALAGADVDDDTALAALTHPGEATDAVWPTVLANGGRHRWSEARWRARVAWVPVERPDQRQLRAWNRRLAQAGRAIETATGRIARVLAALPATRQPRATRPTARDQSPDVASCRAALRHAHTLLTGSRLLQPDPEGVPYNDLVQEDYVCLLDVLLGLQRDDVVLLEAIRALAAIEGRTVRR